MSNKPTQKLPDDFARLTGIYGVSQTRIQDLMSTISITGGNIIKISNVPAGKTTASNYKVGDQVVVKPMDVGSSTPHNGTSQTGILDIRGGHTDVIGHTEEVTQVLPEYGTYYITGSGNGVHFTDDMLDSPSKPEPLPTNFRDLLVGDVLRIVDKAKLERAYNRDTEPATTIFVGYDNGYIDDWSSNPMTIKEVTGDKEATGTFQDDDGDFNECTFSISGNGTFSAQGISLERPLKRSGRAIWDSVILSDEKKDEILAAIKQVENHELIFETWGFKEVFEKGTAVSILFFGPPGTGKTLVSQGIAEYLGKELQVISTAEIESSEPGQAERNIKSYFEGGKDKVLLFDECDSLIHDRGAVGMILGAQINQLLSSLENYEGVALFTTNRLGRLDAAFDRRLSLKMELPMPDANLRIKIWQRMFPQKAPLGEIDWQELSSVAITGGYIKNVVLSAARKTALLPEEEQIITHDMLVDCLIEEVRSREQFQDAVKATSLPSQAGYSTGTGYSRTVTTGRNAK